MFLGSIFSLLIGGLVGFWLGSRQAKETVNSQWMRALEEAQTDSIIDEEQRSAIIRMQGAQR